MFRRKTNGGCLASLGFFVRTDEGGTDGHQRLLLVGGDHSELFNQGLLVGGQILAEHFTDPGCQPDRGNPAGQRELYRQIRSCGPRLFQFGDVDLGATSTLGEFGLGEIGMGASDSEAFAVFGDVH